MKKIVTALLLSVTLAACSTPAPKPAPMKLDFSSMGQITLNVQQFGVINRAETMPRYKPYVTYMFQPTLPDAVSRWAHDRFTVTGNPGRSNLAVKEASIVEQPLHMESGFDSWFKRQQATKYTANVEVAIDAVGPDGTRAYATARAMRSYTLPEDPTDVEKSQAYNAMLTGLIEDLNKSMDDAIHDHMDAFIAR